MTSVGAVAEVRRTLTQADFDRFAALSGDDNPIHVDPRYATTTAFGVTVAHGMLLFAFMRAVLRDLVCDAHVVEQRLMFPAPAPVTATITMRLEVLAVNSGRVRVAAVARRDDEEIVLDGETVLVPRSERS